MVQDTMCCRPVQVFSAVIFQKVYDVTVTLEKNVEYRTRDEYWKIRLLSKETGECKFVRGDHVRLYVGYHSVRPQVTREFLGLEILDSVHETYSNGFPVRWPYKKKGYFGIKMGKLISK